MMFAPPEVNLTPTELERLVVPPATVRLRLRLTFQGHSNEVDSPKTSVRVDWDGFWGKTDEEWDGHLKVTQSVVE
jgi:hypothetical protein